MRKRGKEKWVALIFGLVLLLLAGLVALVALLANSAPEPVEPPEMTAKRLSADNAYSRLAEAARVIPRPAPAILERWLQAQSPEMLPGTLNQIKDDPQAIAYFEQCRAAAAGVREALKMPYLMLPSMSGGGRDDPQWDLLRRQTQLLSAQGLWQTIKNGADIESFALVMDGVRLGQMMENDGAIVTLALRCQRLGLFSITEIATRPTDAGILETVARTLESMAARPHPLGAGFEYQVLAFRRQSRVDLSAPGEVGGVVARLFDARYYSRERANIERVLPTFLEVCDLPFPEFRAWQTEHPEFAPNRGQPSAMINQMLENRVIERTQVEAAYAGAALAIALERHKLAHGDYPDALDALSPEFLPTLPMDPFSGNPFLYRKVGGDYTLYSVGSDGKDDGGTPTGQRTRDFMIHRAASEIQAAGDDAPPVGMNTGTVRRGRQGRD